MRIAKISYALGLLCVMVLASRTATAGGTPRLVEHPEWKRDFDASGVVGTMVLRKDGSDDILVYDAKRAATPYLPASTFKILNTCIALETKVVSGPDEVFPYDGKPRAIPAWNADLSLAQAFAVSCVPVFQDIARRIGPERMARFVKQARYGNADIGGGIDRFWLSGALRITALEQIDFLSRLDHGNVPFSPATIDAVRAIMIVENTPNYVLRAKTGWATSVTPGIGWYVGMLKRGGDTWYFALNVDIADPEQLKARQDIVKAVLRDAGLL